MSALARYFNLHGKTVGGYDKTRTPLTVELEKEGMQITYEDSVGTLDKKAELVVFTPAIPKDHRQLNWYRHNGYVILKRAEILGLAANRKFNICIAGSHGKTSVSSITAHLLKSADKSVAAFLGGISINYNSNFIDGDAYAVAEADEFDRSFLHLEPDIALITSVDTDHLDIYGNLEAIEDSFKQFTHKIRNNGVLISNSTVSKKVLNGGVKNIRYSVEDTSADVHANNLKIKDGTYVFDVVHPKGVIQNVVSHYGGRHNVENAMGAIAIALETGISEQAVKTGIASFKGVRRRFETHLKTKDMVYVDDYAHHPRELDAAISAVKELYPDRKLTVIFQPHLYSRTRDLADEFADSLSKADSLILLDIYPARELPIEGVTSQLIFDKVRLDDKQLIRKQDLLDVLGHKNLQAVLTAGAGDIDAQVQAVTALLRERSETLNAKYE
jgi:UDP-N-acetylmuramate--alanine ligase